MLDFRLETFLTVCKTMNLTQAAEILHLTQPAVTHHIKTLEAELGTPLFTYQKKKLHLTEAGNLLKQSALTMRNDTRLLKEKICSLQENKQILNFGATLTVGEFTMPPVLSAYLKRYPEARITMQVADTRQLLQKIDSGQIDFAIVEGSFPQNIYDSLPFQTERFLGVCGREYLFQSKISQIKDLINERLLLREQGSGSRQILQVYLESQNLSVEDFPHRCELGNIAVLKDLVKNNCGITFLYEEAVKKELTEGSLREIPLRGFQIKHDFSFLWRKGSLFSGHYREIFHELRQLAAGG